MELKMNYEEGVKYLQDLCEPDLEKYSRLFVPNDNFPDFLVNYPGRKEAKGDYQFFVEKKAYSHVDICAILFSNYIESCNRFLGSEITIDSIFLEYVEYLESLYSNGTRHDYSGFSLVIDAEKYANMIYWITMQEEINYPQDGKNWGRRLPFCRYYEAICYVNDIYCRCNNLSTRYPMRFTNNWGFYIDSARDLLNDIETFELSHKCVSFNGKDYGYVEICAELYKCFIDSHTGHSLKETDLCPLRLSEMT